MWQSYTRSLHNVAVRLFPSTGNRAPKDYTCSLDISIHLSIRHFHSWMEPDRILLLGTMIHPITFLPLITHQCPWPIFDLEHDLHSISCIGFQTISWMESASISLHGTLIPAWSTVQGPLWCCVYFINS